MSVLSRPSQHETQCRQWNLGDRIAFRFCLITYQRVGGDHLILDGAMDNHKIHIQLLRVDNNQFLLISRGFHWVQEFPFNR